MIPLVQFGLTMSKSENKPKLWGGCFKEETNQHLVELNKSLGTDKRLFKEDIDGSVAYAEILFKVGLLTQIEFDKIVDGLNQVKIEWIENKITFLESDEDIHTVNERRLTELIGDVGGKLHTGRSRNDQVTTDMRLWMKSSIKVLIKSLVDSIEIIANKAKENLDDIMPGYTHLQRAQPVRFSHWILSHAFALQADITRFEDLLKRVDVLPLGSGAISGNPFNIDRKELAKLLGFSGVTSNSMLAVSDRDFVGM